MRPKFIPIPLRSPICPPRSDTREIGSRMPSRWSSPTGRLAYSRAQRQSRTLKPRSRNPLLCIQCADRFPIRTRRIACKCFGPAEKQRGRLVDISDPLEAFCRGVELTGPPMRETLGIGRGSRRLLRRLLPRLGEQFVNLYRGGASLDPDGVKFTPSERRSGERDRHFRGGDRGAVILVGT